MDIDPKDVVDKAAEAASSDRNAWINPAVAIAIALLATFTGICKVKDDNIVQAMQQAQADRVDHWAYYQARNVRGEVARSTAVQLRLEAEDKPPARRAAYLEAAAQFEAAAQDQAKKREELRQLAEGDQRNYDALNFRDDQFDLSDALVAIAISLLAITTLTRQAWLYALSLVPAGCGVWMGLSGLLGWRFHPDALIKLLS